MHLTSVQTEHLFLLIVTDIAELDPLLVSYVILTFLKRCGRASLKSGLEVEERFNSNLPAIENKPAAADTSSDIMDINEL